MHIDQAASLGKRWAEQLDELRRRGRYRMLAAGSGIDVCSNDYLGYATRAPEPPSAHHDPLAARRSAGAARLVRGHHAIWDEVETMLARWHGCPAALVMSSGYAANEGLLSTIIERDDWVASDRLNHASIIDGLQLARAERFLYQHADLNHLEVGLRAAAANRTPSRQLFIVTESLFGMDGDIAPLEAIAELAERYDAHLIIDEAHATGCYGEQGSGLVDALGLRGRITASVHTGGKALAVFGAYVCGSELLRELLINRCRQFMFSTALPPALGFWWRDAIARVAADAPARAALHSAAARFRDRLAACGVRPGGTQYIVPVIVGRDAAADRAAAALRARGWDVRAIRPPTVPENTARLRLSIHADHPPGMLAELAAAVAEALGMAGDE